MPLTIGDLKDILKDLPDETPVVALDDNFELGGAVTDVSAYHIGIKKYRKESRRFTDAFDGTTYRKESYIEDNENGTEALCL